MLFVLWNERFCTISNVVSLRNLPQIILSLMRNNIIIPSNLQTTPSIFMANYSPLSSERGWGWGFVCLTLFYLLLSTTPRSQLFSSRNSVRVVLLIARGWRGTSLPRVNVRKEIQRYRCWAFSEKARSQWIFLWRINQKKRNTYGVVSHKPYANPG